MTPLFPNLTSNRYVKKKGQRLGKQSDNVRTEMSAKGTVAINRDDAKDALRIIKGLEAVTKANKGEYIQN